MSGLDRMKTRLGFYGQTNDDRLVRDKAWSMHTALKNSYQAEWITYKDNRYRCLINRDKTSEDYDRKEISIDFTSGVMPGSVFYWDRTKAHWIVHLRQYTEEAYLRATINRCDYNIQIDDETYWISLRGPVETDLVWQQKNKTEFNHMNYSIRFLITKTPESDAFMHRHQIVKFEGHNWRVAAVDRYSQEGIIEVMLEEYYDNNMEDKQIIPEITVEEPSKEEPHIEGPQIVKCYSTNVCYSVVDLAGGVFVIDSNKIKINNSDETKCSLNILAGKPGNFEITYQVTKDDGTKEILARLPVVIDKM